MTAVPEPWLEPDWPRPPGVQAVFTTRTGGGSEGPHASLNLGANAADEADVVAANRARVEAALGVKARWLDQAHGTNVEVIESTFSGPPPTADGSLTAVSGVACAILVADCLPILACDHAGERVGGIHAGWRGLSGGIVEQFVVTFGAGEVATAWLGPCIGPCHYEVGQDVVEAFPQERHRFAAGRAPGKWFFDLAGAARDRLTRAGVTEVRGGGLCTHCDGERFFSHRRDGPTGRMAALIWKG